MPANHELIAAIRAVLERNANPEIGEQQQAYMKSTLPYRGIKMPHLRKLMQPLLTEHTLRSHDEWESTIRELWDSATHREEWYAAIAIARYGRYREYRRSLQALPLFEHLIRAGAWWDVCDEIAQHLVGEVVMQHREDASAVMRSWSTDDDLWIRRCSILSQGTHREKTDPQLLRDCILPSIDDEDFFSRKAIGWALRDYSRFDPEFVRTFVAEFEDRLSPLSKREALRLLPED